MKILIVGNGSIGVTNNFAYINNHTGNFLKEISNSHFVNFVQNSTVYDANNNLQNFDLVDHQLIFTIPADIKSLQFLPQIFQLIRKYDFIYIFYPGTLGKIISLIAIFLKIRIGLYIRGQYYKQNFIDTFILRRSEFILTVSPSIADDLLNYCPNVDVIRPMISINQDDFKLDRMFHIPNIWNLLFVGRVEERKGIEELIGIAQYLKANNFKFVVNIVGGGDLFVDTKNRLVELELTDCIQLHGLISEKERLKSFYDEANAFIFTSHDEGFPRVLYEAMASALPIFTTFVGGIPGRMYHLNNCIEIPIRDAKNAGILISKYLNDQEILERIGINGQETLKGIIDGSLMTHEDLLLSKLNDE